MKGHHVNITKRGLSRGRSPIVGNKRNQKLQWNAAKHFCQWGDVSCSALSATSISVIVLRVSDFHDFASSHSLVLFSHQAIGTRLSELCHSDSESPANILGYIFDEETKRRMRKEDEEEDYLDDSESALCAFFLTTRWCQISSLFAFWFSIQELMLQVFCVFI